MGRKITLLYAEDEVETRKNHIEYLKERYDFNYVEASDGEAALALYKVHKPEIILTDVTMPNMDGLTFVQHVRESSPHTKIVVLTAYDEREKLMKALDLNVVNYLLKPINRKKLSSAIELALETLPGYEKKEALRQYIDSSTSWDEKSRELYRYGESVALSQFEKRLLTLLFDRKNTDVSADDIFLHVWNSHDQEFSMDSIRTLVKKLRKKLPAGAVVNSYGGFYRLTVR